jgi:hypothetical protein
MRKLMLLATSGLVMMTIQTALAGVAPDQAALLKTTLTPMGSIRAGSADGLIPAWTGGDTTVTSAPHDGIPPSPYAAEKKILTIDASNMAQYSDRLSDGVKAMMTRYPGFHIDIYPTHRSAAAPQWVYDNTYNNALNSAPAPDGILNGFVGAYGGVPFPILDKSDPNLAGAQIVWNHMSRWQGASAYGLKTSYVVNQGVVTLASAWDQWGENPYYQPGGNAGSFNGYMTKYKFLFVGPPNLDGSAIMQWQRASGDVNNLTTVWQYLNGQGRVREAPELTFDTPSGQADDISNYDEYFMFNASPAQYDWKYIGEKEVYVPYNENNMFLNTPDQALLTHFINPDDVRWELHRVLIVDGTLRQGSRNVMARRRFYVDEDTWTILLADEWDAKGNLYHVEMGFNEDRPDLPGTFLAATAVYNLLTDQYTTPNGPWNAPTYSDPAQVHATDVWSSSIFDAQALAAQDQF